MQFRQVGLLAALLGASFTTSANAQTTPSPGKRIFIKCAACHGVDATGPKRIGPHLAGIVGRKAGSVAGANYSPAMKAAAVKLRWDEATLDKYLTRPSSVVPGTTMIFAGLPKAEERKALIAYLKKPTP